MKYLLFGGAPGTGKTTAIHDLALRLNKLYKKDDGENGTEKTSCVKENKIFRICAGEIPQEAVDFKCVLESSDQSSRIIINSATDDHKTIKDFKKFYDENGGGYSILISSIRDRNDYNRSLFFEIMKINEDDLKSSGIEIPLGKVRKAGWRQHALEWYSGNMNSLVDLVLSNSPFNIKELASKQS